MTGKMVLLLVPSLCWCPHHVYLLWVKVKDCLALYGVLNVKAQAGAFSVMTNIRMDIRLKLYSLPSSCWTAHQGDRDSSNGIICTPIVQSWSPGTSCVDMLER